MVRLPPRRRCRVGGDATGTRKRGSAARRRLNSSAAWRLVPRFWEKLTAARIRQELLGSPEGDGRGSGAGAFEGDFAEVEFFGGEVGEGRVVLVEAAYAGIAEEDSSAAVGLEAVFVGVDDDGVGVGDGVVGSAGGGREVGREGEVASVGRVDVDAEFVFLLEEEDLVEGIDGSDGGGAEGGDYGADVLGLQGVFEGGEIHAAGGVGRNLDEGQAEDRADASVSVVGLVGGGDSLPWQELAGDPEGFEVGEGSAGTEMAEGARVCLPAMEQSRTFLLVRLRPPVPWRNWRGRRRGAWLLGLMDMASAYAARAMGCGGLSIWPA